MRKTRFLHELFKPIMSAESEKNLNAILALLEEFLSFDSNLNAEKRLNCAQSIAEMNAYIGNILLGRIYTEQWQQSEKKNHEKKDLCDKALDYLEKAWELREENDLMFVRFKKACEQKIQTEQNKIEEDMSTWAMYIGKRLLVHRFNDDDIQFNAQLLKRFEEVLPQRIEEFATKDTDPNSVSRVLEANMRCALSKELPQEYRNLSVLANVYLKKCEVEKKDKSEFFREMDHLINLQQCLQISSREELLDKFSPLKEYQDRAFKFAF